MGSYHDATGTFANVGAWIGATVLGFSGCAYCQNNYPPVGSFPIPTWFNLITGLMAGGVVGAIVGAAIGYPIDQEARQADELKRLEAEAMARASAHEAALAALMRLSREAQAAAGSLPIILAEAELTLDRAEKELASNLPSPFWEAMEEAVAKLRAFHGAMFVIEARRTAHRTSAAELNGAPPFVLTVSVLPDPAATHTRLNRLYRHAQSLDRFPIVYEQRRTTATLIAGFRSLGQTIERLGDRIVEELGTLAATLDCRLGSLESSLESWAASSGQQTALLRAEMQRVRDVDSAILGHLRQDAEASSDNQRLALRMLDNIQRRKDPPFLELS